MERDGRGGFDDLARRLSELRAEAGLPSFTSLTRQIGRVRERAGRGNAPPGRVTVYEAFQPGRRRIDIQLYLDIVEALGFPDRVEEWRELVLHAVREQAAIRTVRPRVAVTSAPRADEAAQDRTAPVSVLATPETGVRALGRDREIEFLIRTLRGNGDGSSVLTLVTGLPGSGKSLLARTVAQKVAAELGAVVVVAALRTWSTQDGAPTVAPDDLADEIRSVLVRNRIGARTDLVVMVDDADSAERLTALIGLLPVGTRIIATSRRRLTPTAAHTALSLEPLDPRSAVDVLRASIARDGGPTLDDPADESVLRELVALCGHLPLAIDVLAGQLRSQPGWTPADHLHRLSRTSRSLQPAIESGYSALAPDTRHVLYLLALHPASLTDDELAVMAGSALTSGRPVRTLTDELTLEHLVRRRADGRIDIHDAVRALASDGAQADLPRSAVRAAVVALAHHFLPPTHAALSVLGQVPVNEPWLGNLSPTLQAALARDDGRISTAITTSDRARAWLGDHIEVLVTTVQLVAEHDEPLLVSVLQWLLVPHLTMSQRWLDRSLLEEVGSAQGVPALRPSTERGRAMALVATGRTEAGITMLRQLAVAPTDDRYLTLVYLTAALAIHGAVGEAVDLGRQALDGALAHRDRPREQIARSALGQMLCAAGHLEEARREAERSMELATLAGDSLEIALTWQGLLEIAVVEGNRPAAEHALGQVETVAEANANIGLALFASALRGFWRLADDPEVGLAAIGTAVAELLSSQHLEWAGQLQVLLASAQLQLGRYAEAEATAFEALQLSRVRGFRVREVEALVVLALSVNGRQETEQADLLLQECLEVAQKSGYTLGRARALLVRGDLAAARADRAAAVLHWKDGAAIVGSPRSELARELRQRLDG